MITPVEDNPELTAATRLFHIYARAVKLSHEERRALMCGMLQTVQAGGTVSLVHTSNGLEFRIQSKEKKRANPKPKSGQPKASAKP